MQAFLQRVYDNGYIDKGVYQGLYCVRCEDYYTEEELVDGNCPHHGTPVIFMEEENYFFKLDAFEDRLLEWYDANPEAVRPAAKRNEALGFIKGGLRPDLDHPDLAHVGGPGPLGRRPRLLRLVRRADQLPHRHRVRHRRRAVRVVVAGGAPPDRQGDPPVPLRVVAGHVHGRRHRPAGATVRARVAALRRREAVQDHAPAAGAARPTRSRSPTWPPTC